MWYIFNFFFYFLNYIVITSFLPSLSLQTFPCTLPLLFQVCTLSFHLLLLYAYMSIHIYSSVIPAQSEQCYLQVCLQHWSFDTEGSVVFLFPGKDYFSQSLNFLITCRSSLLLRPHGDSSVYFGKFIGVDCCLVHVLVVILMRIYGCGFWHP